jgi:hypothetical protein
MIRMVKFEAFPEGVAKAIELCTGENRFRA